MTEQNGLGARMWCGIVAVAAGAAALAFSLWIGLGVLLAGGAFFGRACYLDYRAAHR
ncbi:MAG: hypothetical protein PVF27_05225 [Gemmatimonadales bacterium]|jgi:hypothetical protein